MGSYLLNNLNKLLGTVTEVLFEAVAPSQDQRTIPFTCCVLHVATQAILMLRTFRQLSLC